MSGFRYQKNLPARVNRLFESMVVSKHHVQNYVAEFCMDRTEKRTDNNVKKAVQQLIDDMAAMIDLAKDVRLKLMDASKRIVDIDSMDREDMLDLHTRISQKLLGIADENKDEELEIPF